jgi:RNA polymerase sigma factor (sigma-70 family)
MAGFGVRCAMRELPAGEPSGADTTACLPDLLAQELDSGFTCLFRSEEQVVYSVALQLTRHEADAEDLTAETFLRAYQALLGYDRARVLALRPRSWLVAIALNIWRNAMRDAARRPPVTPVADLPHHRTDGPSVEQAAVHAENQRELGAAGQAATAAAAGRNAAARHRVVVGGDGGPRSGARRIPSSRPRPGQAALTARGRVRWPGPSSSVAASRPDTLSAPPGPRPDRSRRSRPAACASVARVRCRACRPVRSSTRGRPATPGSACRTGTARP